MIDTDNYTTEKLTIDLLWANVFGIFILIPIILLFGIPYYLIWKPSFDIMSYLDAIGVIGIFLRLSYALCLLLSGIIVHELIHGIVWAAYASKGFKSIKFGVLWSMLTPYCHCKEPLRVKQYITGAIAPAILLGILPALYAIASGNLPVLIFGMFFTMAAAGDLLIINLIRKENKNALVQDHPSEAGCYIYRKK